MCLFKKRKPTENPLTTDLPKQGDALPESLKALSGFVKRVNCRKCGAPKLLPSATAYLYCDFCGTLMDYDFRLANAGTNAGITNTIYHRLFAEVQADWAQANKAGDKDKVREIYKQVYAQWVSACPQAVSPRAKQDEDFRRRLVEYFAESAVVKDFDPRQHSHNLRMQALEATLQRIPVPGGAWRSAGGFWPYAELFKEQMELNYELIFKEGVNLLDPDNAPLDVALHMEYSTFCQAWLPHLSPEEGAKLLALYGLDAQYDEVKPLDTEQHACGHCGAQLTTLPGAKKVICESCGYAIEVGGAAIPCRKCGALLSFPEGVIQLACPYCQTDTRRV